MDMFEKDRLYDVTEVMEKLNVGRHYLYRARKAGKFPEPLVLGERTYRWPGAALQAWLDSKRQEAAA